MSPADVALQKKTEWLNALDAIAQGYPVRGEQDRYIVVENPYFREDMGNDPNIVIDVEDVRALVKALGG
jgi:hypothetical protein